jgi:uncharacterized protein (DUF2249 family)
MEIDIRTLPPAERHRAIHLRLEELEPGRTLRVVNDHDPRPVRYELEDAHPGCFTWTYVECGPQTWRVDVLKTHDFEPFEDVDLLADSPGLRIAQIRVPAGAKERVMNFAGGAALIFDEGAGMLEVSGRRRAIAAGTVEIVCPGETCTVSAATELHAYVAIAKQPSNDTK